MQKLQDSVFSIVKTTNLSPAVFSYLQPSENAENIPLGGILSDTKHGWLALGAKFCVVDLRTGLKVAARTFGVPYSNTNATITSVIELPTPLTENSKQLVVCLECEDLTGLICILHVNGSQVLRCIQTDVVITQLAVCDAAPDGPLTSFDGIIMAGSKRGEIFAFDLNRASLIQALKDISQGYEHLVRTESNPANLAFLSLNNLDQIDQHRDQALENDDHLALILNETSLIDGQYLFRNPDGSIRMKAKRDHIRVSSLQYVPQLGSLAVGYNFGAFQIWNMMSLELEFASQVNRECLPVTHFAFQEPCDDPRAFCYLWAVFSPIERFEEEEFPLAVMYSLTYQGKRMLSDTKCLYQEFLTATLRFQVELGALEQKSFLGARALACRAHSVRSTLGEEGEDTMLNICQLVWECWTENPSAPTEHGMLLFDLDQWYKDQMPSTYGLQSNAFMSASWCGQLTSPSSRTLDVRLQPSSVAPYSHATRLEEHFYPNSIHYNCICLNTSDASVLNTIGIQRQIISSMDEIGPTALLNPPRLYHACVAAGLAPLYTHTPRSPSQEEQRKFLLSVALEARLSRFLKRCAHDWATGSHHGVGCTLPFLVEWCWSRAVQLKENAKELTAPLFSSSSLPDRNVVRCLEHCVQQLTQLTGLLDAILTKCCNLIVPEALSEIEEKLKGVGAVAQYFQVVQWFLRVGLLPERRRELPYPRVQLQETYTNRRLKLQRLQSGLPEDASKPCPLLYIDQLIEHEFGGERIQQMWMKGGSETEGLYPPPSLYSLLRLYLLPDVAEEHKHSLVLYLLVDYSMVYEVRYEAVVRRLMQFPTMFGLSNTAIKATQAFWHLDHRDFDFALDQLQCLTGNTLSPWQHHVVLSSLLAQNKTQAALQYLHVRKPPPVHNPRVNDHDKLEDWRSCCELYLARKLVYEALDVVRMCAQNAGSLEDKLEVLNFFFKGCRNTGQLSKILQVTLLPFEEEAFIKYLERCDDPYASDILIMYFLQQARYLEAQQHNTKLRHTKRPTDVTASASSLLDGVERDKARDTLVAVVCDALPAIAAEVARTALTEQHETHIVSAKPMSVFVQTKSPKNTLTYKSSFIQDTIENASETWVNRPKMRRGLKRSLNIEDTPFICTPKLSRTKSIFSDFQSDTTPPKRAKFDLSGTPRTPKFQSSHNMSRQMATLLDLPEAPSPVAVYDRSGAGTPHSILKIRASGLRDGASPTDSRYLDSDDELETASNHTHYSDSTNKHLRFTIPRSECSSPSAAAPAPLERDGARAAARQREMDDSMESFVTSTSTSHGMKDENPLESPLKKLATEEKILSRKSYKDNVRGRHSLSISANSSLSEEPNTSVESIADLPVTLVNPRYRPRATETDDVERKRSASPRTPMGRRSIRSVGESTPLVNRSRSGTPEHVDSPIVTPLRSSRITRSRSRTPEISPRSSPLASIPEQPRLERDSPAHTRALTVPARLRSRSRTPERLEKVAESPRLAAIAESPTKPEPEASPATRSRRLRSRELQPEAEAPPSPRTLRSRSKTPEKLISPKPDRASKAKKPLSRIVLEANTFAKSKHVKELDTEESTDKEKDMEVEIPKELIECTPMKPLKPAASMDVSFSPIVNKSVLADTPEKEVASADSSKTIGNLPAFTKINETQFGKSILQSCESSAVETSQELEKDKDESNVRLPTFVNESIFGKSVLRSYDSSVNESVHEVSVTKEVTTTVRTEISTISCKSVLKDQSSLLTNDSDSEEESNWKERVDGTAQEIQKEKERIVEIEREIHEIEGDMSDGETSDEEIVEAEDDSDEDDDEDDGDSTEEDVSMSGAEDDEVISIGDSSNESSLHLHEQSSSDSNRLEIHEPEDKPEDRPTEDPIEVAVVSKDTSEEKTEQSQEQDPLNQGQVSLLTDDNSYMSEEMDLNYDDDDQEMEEKEKEEKERDAGPEAVIKIDIVVEEVDPAEENKEETPTDVKPATSKSVDVVDTCAVIKKPEKVQPESPTKTDIPVKKPETETVDNKVTVETGKPDKPIEKETETEQKPEVSEASKEEEKQTEKQKPSRLRKRAASTSSNKSSKDDKEDEETPRKPMTRKRAQSTASNQSEDLTPTKTKEVRKVLTRRASKEIENITEEKTAPQRRATRSQSKNDDNVSVASEGSEKSGRSGRSTRSKSEKSEARKRKSVVAVKPELSAIPEMSVDESKADVSEYSSSRRLTRHQQAVLSSLQPRPRAPAAAAGGSPFHVQPLDRLSLLNKTDFEGSPDSAEPARASPESTVSQSSGRTPRAARAVSETKTAPKAAKIGRRASVDVVSESPVGSPGARGRRASFTRACEALHTPNKGRRTSTDVRAEGDSAPASPAGSEQSAPATPVRRPRRASTQSNTSASGKEPPKRSRKLPTVEESESKK